MNQFSGLYIFVWIQHSCLANMLLALILLFTTTPTFANSVDPDQMASDLDLHCLSFSLWIWTKTLYDVVWLADSQKWVWLINLFSKRQVLALDYSNSVLRRLYLVTIVYIIRKLRCDIPESLELCCWLDHWFYNVTVRNMQINKIHLILLVHQIINALFTQANFFAPKYVFWVLSGIALLSSFQLVGLWKKTCHSLFASSFQVVFSCTEIC